MRGVHESGPHAQFVQADDRAGTGQGARGAERTSAPPRSAQGPPKGVDGGGGGGFTSNRHLLSLLFWFAAFHRVFLALTRHWHWEPAQRDQRGLAHTTMRWMWPLELWCARVLGVTQSYEFTEKLDVDKRYVFAVRHLSRPCMHAPKRTSDSSSSTTPATCRRDHLPPPPTAATQHSPLHASLTRPVHFAPHRSHHTARSPHRGCCSCSRWSGSTRSSSA